MIRRMIFDLDGPLPNSMFVRNPAGGAALPSVGKTPAGEPAGKDTHLYCCMAPAAQWKQPWPDVKRPLLFRNCACAEVGTDLPSSLGG